MNGFSSACLFVLGSGLIALWIHARFAHRFPERLLLAFAHAALATLALQIVLPFGERYTALLSEPTSQMANLFLVIFPVVTYWFLGITWIIKSAQSLLGGTIR